MGTMLGGKLDPAFCDQLHLFTQVRLLSKHITEDFFVTMVSINISMIKAGDTKIQGSSDQPLQ